jgi:hypothetical protein
VSPTPCPITAKVVVGSSVEPENMSSNTKATSRQPVNSGGFGTQSVLRSVGRHFLRPPLPRPTIPAQYLILCYLPDALRLLVAHLNRGDLIAIGNPARYLLTSGLDLL